MAITPEQARAELERRKGTTASITPEQAKAELERRKGTPEQPGFIQGIAQDIARPFLRMGTNAANIGAGIVNFNDPKKLDASLRQERDFGYLGKVKPIGQTGSFLGDVKDSAGVALQAASTIIPAAKAPGIAKATFGGKVLSGIGQGMKTGFQGGVLHGAGVEAQNADSTLGSIAKSATVEGIFGGTGGAVLGGVLPIPAALNKGVVQKAFKPSSIMQRVARVNALDAEKFQKMYGKPHGEYLTERGIYGSPDEIVVQLADRFQKSKGVADTELAKLGGTWKTEPVTTMADTLLERELRISSPGAPTRDLARVQQLAAKNKANGLNMSEINELKRIYERNIKLNFLKENNTDGIARANTIDDAVRTWQFDQAKKLGLENLQEINKETQLARQLGDALLKKESRSGGNNAFGLTDAILISGGDPNAIAMLLTKKGLGSAGVQSFIAKTLAGEPTVGLPTGKTRAPITDESKLLPGPSGVDTSINNGTPIPVLPKTYQPGTYTGPDTIVAPTQGSSKPVLPPPRQGQSTESLPPNLAPKGPQSRALPPAAGNVLAASLVANPNEADQSDTQKLLSAVGAIALTRGRVSPKEAQAVIARLNKQIAKLTSKTFADPKKIAAQEHDLKAIQDAIRMFQNYLK